MTKFLRLDLIQLNRFGGKPNRALCGSEFWEALMNEVHAKGSYTGAGVGKAITAPNGAPSRILIRDTWNTEILDELKPEPGDVVLYKNRFSGFHQTDLDAILKKKRIRHLIFTGCTTGVCVESTVRDAIFRDYAAVVLADCTAEPSGFEMTHNATLTLIEKRLFGSVSSSDEFVRALK